MKCNSCKVDIDTKWKFAIAKNTCPFCGEEILPIDLKEHIDSINNLFNNFPEKYSNDIEDWLFSNFNLVKIGSEKFNNLMPPKVDIDQLKEEWEKSLVKKEIKNNYSSSLSFEEENDEKDPSLVKKHDQTITNKFFERAEAVKNPMEKTEKLKNLVKQIKKNGKAELNSYIEEENEDIDNDQAEDSYEDNEDLNNLNLASVAETFDSKNLITSSLQSSDDDYEEEVPMALVSAMKNMKNGQGNNKDLIALQQLQNKTKSSKGRMLSGRGAFSRSS